MLRTDLVRLTLAVVLVCAGCGAAAEEVRVLTGESVGRMAELQLEAEHPGMSPGSMACQDLVLEVGASTRCTRTAELTRGRLVLVNGTVEVTSVEDGGKLHVQLDDRADAFGLAGPHLASRVRARFGEVAEDVTCPDLDGVVGAAVTCSLAAHTVTITVVTVDAATYDVGFTVGPLRRTTASDPSSPTH